MPELKNIKHERFAALLWKGEDPQDAYVKAGYKPNHGNAYRLKDHDVIKERVAELHRKTTTNIAVTVERIALETARVAFANITDVIEYDGEKLRVRAFEALTPDVTAAIASIKQTKDGQIEVKMHPKQPALDLLAKFKGMFKENTNLLVTHATLADLVNLSYQQDLALPEMKTIENVERGGSENNDGS